MWVQRVIWGHWHTRKYDQIFQLGSVQEVLWIPNVIVFILCSDQSMNLPDLFLTCWYEPDTEPLLLTRNIDPSLFCCLPDYVQRQNSFQTPQFPPCFHYWNGTASYVATLRWSLNHFNFSYEGLNTSQTLTVAPKTCPIYVALIVLFFQRNKCRQFIFN